MCKCVYIHTHIHIYVYIYIHTYVYTCQLPTQHPSEPLTRSLIAHGPIPVESLMAVTSTRGDGGALPWKRTARYAGSVMRAVTRRSNGLSTRENRAPGGSIEPVVIRQPLGQISVLFVVCWLVCLDFAS